MEQTEQTTNAPHPRIHLGTEATQHKKTSDYVYQAATIAAALLLLLTATA